MGEQVNPLWLIIPGLLLPPTVFAVGALLLRLIDKAEQQLVNNFFKQIKQKDK